MEVQSPQLFDSSTKLPPDTVLGSKYLDPGFLFEKEAGFFQGLFNFLSDKDVIAVYKFILTLFALFFLTVIFYAIVRIFEIRKKEHDHLHKEIREYALRHAEKEKKSEAMEAVSKNERWRQVLYLLFSTSPNDWKLAVIEADTMLEILMGELGYKGENLGEKLKSAGEKNFRHLGTAWEVHTIRNRVAHEGSVFELSHHEAKRVIALYEQIFREFGYI